MCSPPTRQEDMSEENKQEDLQKQADGLNAMQPSPVKPAEVPTAAPITDNANSQNTGSQDLLTNQQNSNCAKSTQASQELETPLIYSPNRRNPRAPRRQNRDKTQPPLQPSGDTNQEWKANTQNSNEEAKKDEAGKFMKFFFFIGGALFGLLGVLVVFLFSIGQSKHYRWDAMRWACIGLFVGFVLDYLLLNMGFDTNSTAQMQSMLQSYLGTGSATGGSIF